MPDERTICLTTATTVSQKGHIEEAIALYERAEQLDASVSPLDQKLAPLYAQQGNFDEAIERYERLAAASPDDVALCNNLAWTLMEAERYRDAVNESQRGLRVDPTDQRLRMTLAMTHYRNGDLAAALDAFTEAENPIAAHHNLAVLEIDAGNADSARQHLRRARDLATASGQRIDKQTEALMVAIEPIKTPPSSIRR